MNVTDLEHCVHRWDTLKILAPDRRKSCYAVLILNQPIRWSRASMLSLWQNAYLRITVDGGTNRWFKFTEEESCLLPDFITGDLDSVDECVLEYYKKKGVPVVVTPDQNKTDFTKAALYAAEHISKMKAKVYQEIGYCPQFDALLEELTVYETLMMFCLTRGLTYSDAKYNISEWGEKLLLSKHIHKKIKEYSGGNKRKLSTALAMVGNPSVVYLDEPTAGMDPVARRHLWNVICDAREKGKCIVLTSHSMEECEALCTRLAIMVNGQFQCLGSSQHLKNKFAEGFTLTVKLKKPQKEEHVQVNEYSHNSVYAIKAFINETFAGAVLREEHDIFLTYYIPNSKLPWSRMFGIMEDVKMKFNIEDYSIGQTTLEQVFLSFARYQKETADG